MIYSNIINAVANGKAWTRLITAAVKASQSADTFNYISIPDMSTSFKEVWIMCRCGDQSLSQISIYNPNYLSQEFTIVTYATSSYYGKGSFVVDWENNRLGCRYRSTKGWGYDSYYLNGAYAR